MPFFSNSGSSGSGDGGLPVLSGTTAPSNSLGVDGQIYIDTAAEVFYGPKTAGSWGSGIAFGVASYNDLASLPATFTPSAHTHAIADVTNLQSSIDAKADTSHTHTKADVADLTTSDLDLAGSRCLFANYYASQTDFPTASSYHGGIAHSHADGAIFFSHDGSWTRLANQSELSSAGLQWTTAPATETDAGTAGELAYDQDNIYLCVSSNLWKKVPLSDFDTGGGGGGSFQIVITSQPSSGTAQSGTFLVSTEAYIPSGDALAYQWQESTDSGATWTDITGATNSSYQATGLTTSDSGKQYRAMVTSANASAVYTLAAVVTVSGSGVSGVELYAPTITQQFGTNYAFSFEKTADNLELGTSGWNVVLAEYQFQLSETNGFAFEYDSTVSTGTIATAYPYPSGAYALGIGVGDYALADYSVNPWSNGGFIPTMRVRGRYRLERSVNGQPEQTTTDWTAWSVARTGDLTVNNIVLSGTTQFSMHPTGGTTDITKRVAESAFATSASINGTVRRYNWAHGPDASNLTYQRRYGSTYGISTPVFYSQVGTRKIWCIGAADYQVGSISSPANVVTPFSTLANEYRQQASDYIAISDSEQFDYSTRRFWIGLNILGTMLRSNSGRVYDPNWVELASQTSGQLTALVEENYRNSNIEFYVQSISSYGSSSDQDWQKYYSATYTFNSDAGNNHALPIVSLPIANTVQQSGVSSYYRVTCRLAKANLEWGSSVFTDVYSVWSNWYYFWA